MLRTITVAELIELLQDEEQDMKVVFAADYGDHGHTEQALAIRGQIEAVDIGRSAYSASGFAIVDDPDEMGRDGEEVLVIR